VKELSVIVPVIEHPDPLDALYEEFSAPLRESGFRFEFLFVFEPGYASLVPSVTRLGERGEPVRALELAYTSGETTLLRVGEEHAVYNILVTLPAYSRIEASSLPTVIQPVLDGAAMAVARRWPRRDSWVNQLQNRVFHLMVQSAGGQDLRDLACGVRAVDRQIFASLPLYGTFHRFLALFARRAGHDVVEVDTPQHPGDRQPRVFTPRVYGRRLLDVFGLYFLAVHGGAHVRSPDAPAWGIARNARSAGRRAGSGRRDDRPPARIATSVLPTEGQPRNPDLIKRAGTVAGWR
jgi:dolichol-phosphate mannosyltransferase